IWGENKILVLAKEITKIYETILKKSIAEILRWLQEDPKRQQGEFVLLLENAAQQTDGTQITLTIDEMLQALMAQMKLKEAVALLANLSKRPKNQLYERALLLKASHQ
ncbi:MAG: rRNA (cytidine-2'-O-)-methyltransferase, partial [Gammaproteobacteria bacterium]|nr:rRNA (cytidine-2'-O-)-methyltransferase [Gammaproteobacteria bacterium]